MDIATFGIAIDSRAVKEAAADLDRLSASASKAEAAIDKLKVPSKSLGDDLRGTARGAMSEHAKGLDNLAGAARQASSGIGALAGVVRFGAAGFAAYAASAAVAFTSTVAVFDNFGRMASSSGVSVKALTELSYAARIAGVSTTDLQNGIRSLTDRMAAATAGNREAASWFRALGVEVKQADGTLRPAEKVLADIAERFSQFSDGSTKSAFAAKTLGESGSKLIPMLNQGAAGLRAAAEEANRFGLAFDERASSSARSFLENIERVKASLDGLKISVGGPILTAINNLIEQFNAGREAAGGFWAAIGRYGLKLGSPDDLIARTTQRIAELQEQIRKDEGTTTFFGRGARDLAERRTMAARGEIAQLERDLRYYRLLARQQVSADVQDGMTTLGGRTPSRSGPAIPPSSPVKVSSRMSWRLGSGVDDQEGRTREAVARLVSDSEIANAREYALQMQELDRLFFDLGLDAGVYDSAMKGLTRTVTTSGEAGEKALRDQAQAWLDLADPMSRFTREIEQVERALSAGIITPKEASEIKARLADALKPISEADAWATQAAKNIQDALGNNLYDILDGKFESIAKSFSTMLKRMTAEAAAASLSRALFGDFAKSGKVGGFLGEGLQRIAGIFSNANGNVYTSKSLSAYSNGIYNTPQFFAFAKGAGVFAEDGAEAIMPLRRGKDGRLGVSADGGGAVINIRSVINAAPGTDPAALKTYLDYRDNQLKADILDGVRRGRYTFA